MPRTEGRVQYSRNHNPKFLDSLLENKVEGVVKMSKKIIGALWVCAALLLAVALIAGCGPGP